MKNLVIGLILALGLSTQVNAFELDRLFGNGQSSQGTINAKLFKIQARGSDLRAYIFEAPGNSDYICMFVAGSQKGGTTCYPKQK